MKMIRPETDIPFGNAWHGSSLLKPINSGISLKLDRKGYM